MQEDLIELTEEESNRMNQLIQEDSGSVSKYGWDDGFQSRILGLLLTDRFFLIQSLDKIKPEYFSKDSHVLIASILFEYFDKYKNLPDRFYLKQEIADKTKEKSIEAQLLYQAEYENVFDFYVPGLENRDVLTDKITYFAKVQSVKITFHKCLERMTRNPESEETWAYIYDQMRESMIVDKNYETGLEYFLNPEEMFLRMQKVMEGSETFTSGFAEIDNSLTGNGLMVGNIGAWIALPGTGKSLAMIKASVENVKRGKKVLYITMEMDELGISQRFTSQFFGKDVNSLSSFKDEIIKEIEMFKEDKHDPNMFVVKQFPGGTLDVNGIRAYYSQLVMRGYKPDLLVVDYVGEMKDDPNLKKYESAYRILRDLRAFGIEQKHCTITCIQPNSTAAKLDQSQYIDESSIGTSFDQFKPLDCLWSINQQVLEKEAQVGRIFVIKHRNGKSRNAFYVKFGFRDALDVATLDIEQITKEEYIREMNLVKEKKSDDVMKNNDSITGDSNEKNVRGKKRGRSTIPFDPTTDVVGDGET
jgi:replicative DNA helicase